MIPALGRRDVVRGGHDVRRRWIASVSRQSLDEADHPGTRCAPRPNIGRMRPLLP